VHRCDAVDAASPEEAWQAWAAPAGSCPPRTGTTCQPSQSRAQPPTRGSSLPGRCRRRARICGVACRSTRRARPWGAQVHGGRAAACPSNPGHPNSRQMSNDKNAVCLCDRPLSIPAAGQCVPHEVSGQDAPRVKAVGATQHHSQHTMLHKGFRNAFGSCPRQSAS